MTSAHKDFFAFPSVSALSLTKVIGYVTLVLVLINAITAIVSIWVGGDILGKIFLSSLNLLFAVIIAYLMITKLLTDKGVPANTLSLFLIVSMFVFSEYLILRVDKNMSEVIIGFLTGFIAYIVFVTAIAYNVLISFVAKSPQVVRTIGVISMVCASVTANLVAYNLILINSNDILNKLALTFALLTLFSGISIPLAKITLGITKPVDKHKK